MLKKAVFQTLSKPRAFLPVAQRSMLTYQDKNYIVPNIIMFLTYFDRPLRTWKN